MRPIIFLFFLHFWSTTTSQFIFKNLRWQDGLSAKEVRCLHKDKDGYLWIGTANGLNRFDGAIVRQFRSITDAGSLYINSIYPLNSDTLLIGTREGIRLFSKKSGDFLIDKRFDLLSKEVISCIKSDPYDRLWIATSSSVFVFENAKLKTAAEFMPNEQKLARQGYSIAAFDYDSVRKGFWVGGDVTYFIDCENKKIYSKLNNKFKSAFLDSTGCYSVAVDNNQNLWFGSNLLPGLNFWNSKTGATQRYSEIAGVRWKSNGPNRIFIDSRDRVWISTWLYAAFIKEPGQPIRKIPFSQTQTYSIGYGHFRDAIEDEEGNVWLGTINGVSKSQAQDPFQAIYQLPSFNFYLETGFAHANYVGLDSNLIVACKEDGIVMYNTNERTYTRHVPSEYERNRFAMAAKSGRDWWFAGNDGIYILEAGAKTIKPFQGIKRQPKPGLANLIFTDKAGNIWMQVIHDALYRYNPVTKKTDRFDGKDSAIGSFNFVPLRGHVVLPNNDLLLGMFGAGLLRFDSRTGRFTRIPIGGLEKVVLNDMQLDKDNNLWIAIAGRGVLKIDQNGRYIDSINSRNGLLSDFITSLSIDGRGFVWAGCREGLMFFNPLTKDVTRVEVDLGQTLQDYWNSINVFNGKVYAVMLDHVVVIDPVLFQAIHVKDPPLITSVEIFGEDISKKLRDDKLSVSPNEDYISFQFASLHHREIPALQYGYQLEGVDKDWVNAGRNVTVSYNNLRPGDYTFKVRSTNENGKWLDKVTQLRITVKPNWWQTWWAFTLYALGAAVLAWLVYRNLSRRRQNENIEKTIDYFANSVYGENSVNEICWDIARNCISQLQFEDCVVYLVDEEKQVLVQKAAFGPKNPKGNEIIDPIEIRKGQGIVGTVWDTGRPQLISDTSKDPRYIVDDVQRNSEVSVPIFHDGRVIGVIDSEHSNKGFFTESHVKALTTIASISANKIAEANAEATAKQNELRYLELSKLLAESQLMALRAQMNPHFVFNCLNSIQECIVTEKYGEASKYLNKFSKLFRTVLNHSGRKFVTIEEEKEVLELYLELEQMRFEQSVEYRITIDEELELDEILLPSMLLQPYVENALWHGLMHKSGERNMSIDFERVNDDIFRCTIDDNGIGRRKSFELKEQQSKAKRHESKGLKIAQDRLTILEKQGHHAIINIIDKYVDNEPAGTRVVIELSTSLGSN